MSYQQGYNNTGTKDSQIANLENQVKTLTLQNNKLKSKLSKAQAECKHIKHRYLDIDEIYTMASVEYPILPIYLRQTFKNLYKEPNGKRYDGLYEFFALLSLYGEKQFHVLQHTLMFPHYCTAKKYRKQALADIGVDDSIFDGSIENLKQIISIQGISGQKLKASMMIDACYVTPYVSVEEDGTVVGLVNESHIDVEYAKRLVANEAAFQQFVHTRQKSIIHAEFVFMIGPINSPLKPFPVHCIPWNSGAATPEFQSIISDLKEKMEQLNFEIQGIGTDGDRQYLKYSMVVIDSIINGHDTLYSAPFVDYIQSCDPFFHFSDPYHLTKRDRYNKVRNGTINCSPIYNNATRATNVLTFLGVPEYLLDDEKARKMEDSLAQRLFSAETIQKIYDSGDIPLLICMLPSALLLDSLHNKGLSRQERIDELLFGASIVYLYYFEQENQFQKLTNKTTPTRKQYKSQIAFNQPWCAEYLSVTFSITYLLLTEECVNLGSCGSHPIEHLFGNIRRLSRGNDTHKQFIDSLKYYVSEGILCERCGVSNDSAIRRLDSGLIIEGGDVDPDTCFLNYLQPAMMLMNNFMQFNKVPILEKIGVGCKKMRLDECIDMLPLFTQKQHSKISTKMMGITSTGGLSNTRKWKAAEQINKY